MSGRIGTPLIAAASLLVVAGLLSAGGAQVDAATASGPVTLSATTLQAGDRYTASIPGTYDGFVFWYLTNGSAVYPLLTGTASPAVLQIPQTVPGGRYSLGASVGTASGGYTYYASAVTIQPDRKALESVTGTIQPPFIYHRYSMWPVFQMGDEGQGQTIALFEYSNINWNDVTKFDSLYGLPPLNASEVMPHGNPGIVDSLDQQEATLDVEWAHAMAPYASITVYLYANPTPDDFNHAMEDADNNGDASFSLSYGKGSLANLGYLTAPLDNLAIERASRDGLGIFVASGDYGKVSPDSTELHYSWPASNEYVVSVGGTMFRKGVEEYWNDSGYSGTYGYTDYPMASWQANEWVSLGLLHSALDALIPGYIHRYMPDVSFVADNVPIVLNGSVATVMGTSIAAPCWAGVWALVDQNYATINGVELSSPAPEVIYTVTNNTQVAAAFTDQSSGSPAPYYERIGFGSPDVYNLVNDVAQLY